MNPPIPAWTAAYETGIKAIDSDHKTLFEEIRHVAAALVERQDQAAVDQAIKCLETYVHEHFQREETFMLNAGYPRAEEHIRLHRALTRQVECLRRINREGLAEIDPMKLARFLSDWLSHHILKVDMDYVPFLKGGSDDRDHGLADRLQEVDVHVPANKRALVERFLHIMMSDHPVAAELATLIEDFENRLSDHELAQAKRAFCVN